MARQFHLDGRLVAASDAAIDVRDRGVKYGDAARQSIRVYGGEAFALDAHLDRLERTCDHLGFAPAIPPRTDLADRIRETLEENDLANGMATISISRGVQQSGLTPDPRVDPTVLVTVTTLPRGGTDGKPIWEGPASVETVPVRTPPEDVLPAEIQTASRVPAVLARLALRTNSGEEADEALLLNHEGAIIGGADSNLFFVSEGTLHTPSRQQPVYPGVTRSVVLELARGESFSIERGSYRVSDCKRADEMFLTNTRWEIRPVNRFDEADFDTGPITRLLSRLFAERIDEQFY